LINNGSKEDAAKHDCQTDQITPHDAFKNTGNDTQSQKGCALFTDLDANVPSSELRFTMALLLGATHPLNGIGTSTKVVSSPKQNQFEFFFLTQRLAMPE